MSKKNKSSKKSNLDICLRCASHCCYGLVMDIKKPKNKTELDELLWYLMYDTARIFIRSRRWHLLVDGKCMHLNKKGLCDIYENRPDICINHMPPECEHFGKFYDVMFNIPDDLIKYMKKNKRKK